MKQGWEIKKLGEVCAFCNGYTPKESELLECGAVPYFKVSDMNHCDNLKYLTHTSLFLEDGYKVYPKHTIVFPKNGAAIATNKKRILAQDSVVDLNTGGVVANDALVYFEYLYLYFLNLDFRLHTRRGAVPTLDIAELKNKSIPVPSRAEQERIVAELDCLSGVIEKKREQLKQLDALAQSIFYQMFGDPITNEKGFPVYKIDDIITFQGGSQPDKSHFEYEPTDDNIRLIQIRDYKSDKNITYIPKSLARRLCNAEDIMIGRYGPPIFQILKGIEGAYNVALMKAIPKQGNREFIRAFLKQKCLLEYLESMSKRTAGQDGIQMDKLKAYPFPLPPIELQDEFADKIEAIEKQKELIKKSISETETLFNARMDYYFN